MSAPPKTKLDHLVGTWTSTDTFYPGAGSPGKESHGSAEYFWGVGNQWLLYNFKTILPGAGEYQVHGGLRFDPGTNNYQAFATNSMGLLMVYSGDWESAEKLVFSMVYPLVQPDTRVNYVFQRDGEVRMISERPMTGGGREIYFETVLTKTDPNL